MLKPLVNLFFPKVCYACLNLLDDNEDTICLNCRHDLPVTNFHFDGNPAVSKALYGRAKIENGTALFRFEKKGSKNKLKKRGYNQVAKFGEQIAEALNAKYIDDVLVKITNIKSQTTKSRLARWLNEDELFALKNMDAIDNKHILLVDDIITTGATLEACANVLNQVKNIKISIATMAIA